MTGSARRKALAFSILLIFVSAGLLVTAAATTQQAIEPFRAKRDYPGERSVTKHGIALAVAVGVTNEEGNRERAVGAEVSIFRHDSCESRRSERLDTKTTGERGHVVFQVRRGCYHLEVVYGNLSATSPTAGLREDTRVGVLFGADGSATWARLDHREMEQRGDAFHLGVRVHFNRSGERVPAAGANVTVLRMQDGSPQVVAEGTADRDGLAVFMVHGGAYVVQVEWRDQTGRQRVDVREDSRVLFYFDGENVRSGQRGR